MTFYVLCDADTKDAFVITDDDCVPVAFTNEADAITAAKEYSATCLVLKPVARVIKKTTHKVEKIK